MRVPVLIPFLILVGAIAASCATYKVQPTPFHLPARYPNVTEVAGAMVGAEAIADKDKAENIFGFDIKAAGMLPVQVVFDNQGQTPLVINPAQTFLEDQEGNLWPVLAERFAYERVTRYAQTEKIFKEGSYVGFLGGVAGALVGAAVGVVTRENVLETAGKGAIVGGAAGATLGGASGYASAESARRRLVDDFEAKSLENKPIPPGNLAYGFIFFPGEANSASRLRLQLIEEDTRKTHTLLMAL